MNDINFLKFFFDSGKYSEEAAPVEKIADFFPALICIYDAETGKMAYTNSRFRDFFGFSTDDFLASDNIIDNIIYQEDLERVKNEIERFNEVEGESGHCFNCRFNHSKEHWRYFKTSGTVLRRNAEGKVRTLLFVAQDITDQMKGQEEIHAMNQLFSETEELLQYGSWTWDLTTDKVTWTKGLRKILGYKPEELGEFVERALYRKHMLPEYERDLDQILELAIKEKKDFTFEHKIRTVQGIVRTISINGKVVLGREGEVVKMIGIIRDITEIRNFEREQEKNVRELNRSNKELEEFAYVASHDLQEPLRKIAMFSERLRSKYAPQLDKDGQLFMDRILASAGNMRTLIDNLLEFSRANRSSQAFTQLDLKSILDQVVANLELKIEETKARIEVPVPLPVVEAVPSEMEQLFRNLLSNAIKFRKPDTAPLITITCSKAATAEKKQQQLPEDKQYYKLEFKDNGIGFEAEYSERIFQIFQRLHGKAEYPGSGIGLAICKRIADNHNGVIFAQSEPDSGATFTVLLPEKQF